MKTTKKNRGTIRINFNTGSIRATGNAANDLFNTLVRAHRLDKPKDEKAADTTGEEPK